MLQEPSSGQMDKKNDASEAVTSTVKCLLPGNMKWPHFYQATIQNDDHTSQSCLHSSLVAESKGFDSMMRTIRDFADIFARYQLSPYLVKSRRRLLDLLTKASAAIRDTFEPHYRVLQPGYILEDDPYRALESTVEPPEPFVHLHKNRRNGRRFTQSTASSLVSYGCGTVRPERRFGSECGNVHGGRYRPIRQEGLRSPISGS